MNAIFPEANRWIAQLQSGSTYFRNLFFVSAVVFAVVGLLGMGFGLAKVNPPISFLSDCWVLGDALACWFAYKLFSQYARGQWFAAQAILWMQAIGALSLVRGGVSIWNNLSSRLHDGFWGHLQGSPLVVQATICVQFVFSQLLHNLVFGCVILVIAQILNEGRKLQEEQELTV